VHLLFQPITLVGALYSLAWFQLCVLTSCCALCVKLCSFCGVWLAVLCASCAEFLVCIVYICSLVLWLLLGAFPDLLCVCFFQLKWFNAYVKLWPIMNKGSLALRRPYNPDRTNVVSFSVWMVGRIRCSSHSCFARDLAIEFLQDVGLLRRKVQCNTCGRDMALCTYSKSEDGYWWRCQKSIGGVRCNQSRSIRHGSWFHGSNLTFEVMYLTYDIMRCERAGQIQREHGFARQTVTNWGVFCRETMEVYLEELR
jgi:hypothetical protein